MLKKAGAWGCRGLGAESLKAAQGKGGVPDQAAKTSPGDILGSEVGAESTRVRRSEQRPTSQERLRLRESR